MSKIKKKVNIYTDGSSLGNPGPGGYGAILVYNNHERELSGGEVDTTNNRMELLGAIIALEALKEPCEVMLYSDSSYLVNGIEKGWAKAWRSKGWIKPDKKPAQNSDLWARLLNILENHDVTLNWIRGHNGHPYNERCDRLAVAYAEKLKNSNI